MRRWWWPPIDEMQPRSLSDAADELRNLFLGSVSRQLRSDVPVGAALSGGVDSSSIVCSMRYLEPDMPIHTFSYLARGSEFNEELWCNIVNEHVGAIAHVVDGSETDRDVDLDSIIKAQGEPFGSSSITASYRVYELARQSGITVTLDGQGADELLGGYEGYPTAIFRSFLDRHDYVGLMRFQKSGREWPGRNMRKMVLHLGQAIVPEHVRALALGAAGYDITPDWLDSEALMQVGAVPRPPESTAMTSEGRGRRLAERLRIALTKNRLPALLRHGDRNSMAWSVESRVPFLSPALAEFALRLPERYLVSESGETKHLFRRAMRGIVPNAILDRRDKIGFATSEIDMLNARWPQLDAWLSCMGDVSQIRPDLYRAEISRILKGDQRFSFRAWRMLCFARWYSMQRENATNHAISTF